MTRGLSIVTGGQTGVDRGALEGARAAGLPTGGWCPAGRRAEDGAIPRGFGLRETDDADYATRTRRNVRDSDGTLLIRFGVLKGGSALTADSCRRQDRPLLILPAEPDARPREEDLERVVAFIVRNRIGTLNIAGPRESEAPGGGDWTRRFVNCLATVVADSKELSLP